MAKLSKYQTLQKKLMSQTTKLFDLSDAKELYTALSNGENSYLRFDRFESSAMDMTWVKQIEEAIPDLNEIVNNPKRTIQTLAEVVEIEKVKKTSRESVQHLASHSQFVKTIDEDGNVTPSKILNVYNDDFFAIYENKFVATLLRRLFIFVEKRYDYIIHQATLRDVEMLYFKNKTNIDGSVIEIETKIRYSKPSLDDADEKLAKMIKRINDIRRYLRFFGNSEFMRILHRERDVRNPILQTNIIRKNPKYRHCYHLWQFINSYNEAGVEVKVEENFSKLSEEDLKEINKTLVMNFLALKGRDAPKEEVKPKIYRPRILKTYDDDMYNPGPSFDAPVEFIRVDEKYRQYMDTLKDLNPHPTRAYQEYMKNEYAENKFKREDTAQTESLIKRSENEYKRYEKQQEELIQKEKEDWEMISDLAEQAIQDEQEERLRALREELAVKGDDDEQRINDAISTEGRIQELIEDAPKKEDVDKPVEEPEEEEELPVVQAAEEVAEPREEPQEEQPVEEAVIEEPQEPIKKKRGGARPGAGRPRKVVEEPIVEPEPELEPVVEEQPVEETPVEEVPAEQPVKKGRGGARPGAGRPRKIRPEEASEQAEEPQEEPVVEEEVPVEEPVEEQPAVKKGRGGARPGAGRPRKVVPTEEPVEAVEEPQEEEQPDVIEETPLKKGRGGARPGAGRPRKVAVVEEPEPEPEPVAEEAPVKKQRGGWRPGAGRKPKNRELPPEVVEEQPEEVIVVKKQRGGARPGAGRKPKPLSERPVKGQWGGARPGAGRKPKPKSDVPVVKKQRGGARPGAGRKPKPRPEAEVVEQPKPVVEPKPKAPKKTSVKKERRLAKKAEREEKQAKILDVKNSRTGKKFTRR